MSLILSILIVYGITLIIVQGKIFSNAKKQLSNLIEYLEKYYNSDMFNIDQMIKNNHKYISEQHINLFNNLISQINDPNNSSKLEKLGELLSELTEKIKIIILEKRKYKILFKILVYLLSLLQELTDCMMCTGFWIGIILSIITLNFNISIYGCLLNSVTTQGDFSTCLTIFLLGGLFSGTTWAINSLVDFLFEIKNSLKSYLDKKTSE